MQLIPLNTSMRRHGCKYLCIRLCPPRTEKQQNQSGRGRLHLPESSMFLLIRIAHVHKSVNNSILTTGHTYRWNADRVCDYRNHGSSNHDALRNNEMPLMWPAWMVMMLFWGLDGAIRYRGCQSDSMLFMCLC